MTAQLGGGGMLRLRDAASGELREVGLRRSSLVHVHVIPGPERGEALRRALVADLIRRVVELHGGQTLVGAEDGLPDLLPYNVHPAATEAASTPDVVVGVIRSGSICVPVGSVSDLDSVTGDPLALRLLLLGTHHTSPVVIRPADLVQVSQQLSGWRELVRRSAAAPSSAMPPEHAAQLLARADDDLDTRGVLDLLEDVIVDTSQPDGARFEFLLYADRLLGLDLAAALAS